MLTSINSMALSSIQLTLETSINQYLSVNGEIMSENMAEYGYAFFKSLLMFRY